ncbi:MAG TPA: hypothetical protein ENI05_12255, partial [Porticoccus sp.]|nr:hypothetical protein [Porticoccus sp.]
MKRFIFFLALLLTIPAFADCDFKADTAATYLLGPMLDSTDGITAETVTVAQADVRLWKEGGTIFAQKNDATGCTQRENGYQTCPLNTTDTNTEGTLLIATDDAVGGIAIVPVFEKCNVLGADEYDRKYGTTAQLTSRDTGLKLGTTVASVTSNEVFVGTAGAGADNSYNGDAITVLDVTAGTGECSGIVDDFATGTTTFTVTWNGGACAFTIAATDEIRVFTGSAATGPTAAAIADAVLQESVDDHKATGASLAEHIDAIKTDSTGIITDTGTDGVILTAVASGSIWAVDATGQQTQGTFG